MHRRIIELKTQYNLIKNPIPLEVEIRDSNDFNNQHSGIEKLRP